MPPKTVIMFPDLDGLGFQEQFGKDLLQKFGSRAKIVPIINGENRVLLVKKANEARSLGFRPTIASNDFGLRYVLQRGYEFVSFNFPDSVLVHLDTEDHPLSEIDKLAKDATKVGGMAVGCLDLSPKAATPGSMEDFANADLFPTLFQQFTNGKLILSGANGFKAFAPGVCGQILPGAIRVMEEADRISGSTPLRYGFDCAMIMSAFHQKVPIRVAWIPTDHPENKPRARIIEQFDCALRICRAAEKINWSPR